jgi:hypothetical protein
MKRIKDNCGIDLCSGLRNWSGHIQGITNLSLGLIQTSHPALLPQYHLRKLTRIGTVSNCFRKAYRIGLRPAGVLKLNGSLAEKALITSENHDNKESTNRIRIGSRYSYR